ncbi:MAG TPA: DinB family protein [Longimicrobiales bacterium]
MITKSAAAIDSKAFRAFLLELAEVESATTLKVLNAYPVDKSELKPHPALKSARDLAWLVTMGQKLCIAALQDSMDLSGGVPPTPETFGEVVEAFERSRERMLAMLRAADPGHLSGTVRFPTGPKHVDDIPKLPFIHFMLLDQIHHRGQFSIYLRLAGGKVPSIYGPTADEPWV